MKPQNPQRRPKRRVLPAFAKKIAPARMRASSKAKPPAKEARSIRHWLYSSLVVAAFLAGLLVGYLARGGEVTTAAASNAGSRSKADADLEAFREQINPPGGYRIGARYGDLGPRLLAAGVIDYDAFAALYDQAGMPLTVDQIQALQNGSDQQIVIDSQDSYFLLNFFWAVGLANRNSILTEGPMVQYSDGKIEGFASTGGWGIGAKPVTDLYASMDLIPLTSVQQARVQEVSSAVYRPCCDNPTSFPDCNHGMAMLGLLELMASQGATGDEMFTAAKYVNAYWFPDQALETAIYLHAEKGIDFAEADPRLVTGAGFASGSGFASIHTDLQLSGLLPQANGNSGSCAN